VDFAGNDGALNTPYGASFPRWKGNLALGWSLGDIHSTLSYQYIGPYRLVLESAPGHVSSYSQFNLNVSYTGFKRLTLYATVKNLLNRAPPFDPIWLAYPTATPYDPSLYNDEGRYVEVGATYRFF
jgi:iron complex outermembrane receptor protein